MCVIWILVHKTNQCDVSLSLTGVKLYHHITSSINYHTSHTLQLNRNQQQQHRSAKLSTSVRLPQQLLQFCLLSLMATLVLRGTLSLPLADLEISHLRGDSWWWWPHMIRKFAPKSTDDPVQCVGRRPSNKRMDSAKFGLNINFPENREGERRKILTTFECRAK